MTDKKVTDYAITVRALEKIIELMLLDGDLQRVSTVSHAIDLINRQKAEIERLSNEVDRLSQCVLYQGDFIVDVAKDFAERLKAKFDQYGIGYYPYALVDDVLSEMGVSVDE